MLICVFILRFNSAAERFDDGAAQAFAADKGVLSVHDHFFTQNAVPYLTLVVRYRTAALPAPADTARPLPQRDESRRELPREDDRPLLNTLRAWRSERPKQDGMPTGMTATYEIDILNMVMNPTVGPRRTRRSRRMSITSESLRLHPSGDDNIGVVRMHPGRCSSCSSWTSW